MRKLLVIAMAAFMLCAFSVPAMAEGDFEMSGHINTGIGFQFRQRTPFTASAGAFTEEGMLAQDLNVDASPALTHQTDVLFYVGDVELDITKTFGENIRLRADLDFLRINSYGFYGQLLDRMIEQAYVTVNIPVGYGLEFLVGRFNAPMGFEAVDNNDNDLPFHTPIFNFLRPQNLTGIKFYYPFSDLVDLHFWLANNLQDKLIVGGANNPIQIPAFGLRLGFTWGTEGQESTFGIGGAASGEARDQTLRADKWGEWTYMGDIDFNIWVNDVFAIGGEGIFRRDGAPKGAKSNYYFGGLLNMHYVFSDVWDGTLRYAYVMDKNGWAVNSSGAATLNAGIASNQFHRYAGMSALGAKLQNHGVDLGINYHITDGAKLMAMYRFEYIIPAKNNAARSYAAGNKSGMTHSVAANFAYEF